MDFFQAQDNAIRKTKRLVLYFALAVVLIVVAVYGAVTLGVVLLAGSSPVAGLLWDPVRFVLVAAGVAFLVGMGSLYKTLMLRGGGSAVAESLGGERIDRSTRDHRRKQLLNVVEEMAIASGVPVPEVYILSHEPSINAFAAGWGTDDAVIAVSAGALEQLSRDELQGVVAHEYSHILYGDCRLNIRLMGLLFGILMLTLFGRLIRAILRGGGRRGGRVILVGRSGGGRRSGGGKGGGGAVLLVVILVIILITIIGYIGTFFGRLIQAAISRQREYLADAAAVQFTRNPAGIAGALKKIGGSSGQAVLEHPNAGEAAHMFFADGLKQGLSGALATHPPLDERIRLVDPGWDGRFTEATATRESPVEAQKRTPAAPPAGRRDPRGFIEGMAVIGAIGTMSQENLASARRLTAAIPEELDALMRDGEGARLAVIALVMADNVLDDEAQWRLLQEAVPAGQLGRIRDTYQLLGTLPREARLAALELASSTLVQSPEAGQADFLSLLNHLIQVDERLSLYEFCLRRILRERLTRRSRAGGAEAPVQYMQLRPEVAEAVGHLLSVVAREASGGAPPAALVGKAVLSQYLLNGKVAYREVAEGALARLDRSLDVLRTSAFAIRAQCLRAAVHCLQADGRLSPEEAEILRMLSLSLDCPLPPLE